MEVVATSSIIDEATSIRTLNQTDKVCVISLLQFVGIKSLQDQPLRETYVDVIKFQIGTCRERAPVQVVEQQHGQEEDLEDDSKYSKFGTQVRIVVCATKAAQEMCMSHAHDVDPQLAFQMTPADDEDWQDTCGYWVSPIIGAGAHYANMLKGKFNIGTTFVVLRNIPRKDTITITVERDAKAVVVRRKRDGDNDDEEQSRQQRKLDAPAEAATGCGSVMARGAGGRGGRWGNRK